MQIRKSQIKRLVRDVLSEGPALGDPNLNSHEIEQLVGGKKGISGLTNDLWNVVEKLYKLKAFDSKTKSALQKNMRECTKIHRAGSR